MKQLIASSVISLVLLISFLSCEYIPSGENFRELAKPDTTKLIQIKLSPFETEYVITYPVQVTYDLNTFGLKVYNVEFLVDGQSVHKGTEATGVFGFDPAPFGIGLKKMKMKVVTNTNTGSVADLTGVEALVYERSWNLLMDGGNPNQIEITRIYNSKGALRIEWEPYTRFNFQKYVLYKNFGSLEPDYSKHIVAEVTDPKQTFCDDLSFIGGTGNYWVEVQASNKSAISARKSFAYDFPKLDTAWVRGDSARFIWRKNPFKKAVRQIKLTSVEVYYNKTTTYFSTSNADDTTLIVKKLKFGIPQKYKLWTYPEQEIGFGNDDQVLKSEISFGIGKSFPKVSKILCSPTENYLFLWDGESFSKMDWGTKKIVASAKGSDFFTWSISNYDGSLLTEYYKTLTRYDKDNLQAKDKYQAFDFGFDSFWYPSISKDNRIAGPVGAYIGRYDLNENRLLFIQKDLKYSLYEFSPDGNYAFDVEYVPGGNLINVYRVTNSGLDKIGKLPSAQYSTVRWIQGSDHKFMAINGSPYGNTGKEEMTVIIYDAGTNRKDIDFQAKIGHFMNIDFYSRQIAFWAQYPSYQLGKNFYIYNFETGKLVKELYVNSVSESVCIFRSHVICTDGYYLDFSTL